MAKRKSSSSAGNPALPSPAEILEFVQSQSGRVGKREIARAFGVRGGDRIELKRLLRKMKDDGLLAGERRRLHDAGDLPPVAVLQVGAPDADGDIVARPVDWDAAAQDDAPLVLVLPDKKAGKAARPPGEGDRILARLSKSESGDTYAYTGRIIRTLTRSTGTMLGVVHVSKSAGTRVLPVDKRDRREYTVERGALGGAKPGELVEVEPVRGRATVLPQVRIVKPLGKVDSPRSISRIAIHQHGLPNRFKDEVLAEAEAAGAPDISGLTDMRSVPLITIDPPDARDHDDAVWAGPDDNPDNEGGHKVIVAIADVARYVTPGSALDREARDRGNSVYFPDQVVPMLPEALSTDLCSLRPDEDRPALAVTMTFNAKGAKTGHRFARIVMRSAAKLSYEQAQRAVDGERSDVAGPVVDTILKPLWAAYRTVDRARSQRAPLALDLPERKIVFNDEGEVDRVVTPPRYEAHKLIEEFMIQANVCAAETLEEKRAPLIYRVHDAPSQEKLKALSEFLATLDINLSSGQVLKPKQFNTILEKVKGKEFERLVHDVVLRSQSQAIYTPDNLGHFGLNLRRYAHFTSPIRRYADLIVHRSLIAALKLGRDGLSEWDTAHLHETAELISVAERRAMAAERDTVDRLIASYLSQQVGAQFSGRIAGVTESGLFVELHDSGANGFVPISTLGQEYYAFDRITHSLVGDSTGETFRLGDPVDVRLEEVTPIAGGMRFEVISPGRPGKPMRQKHRGKRHGARRGGPARRHQGRSRR